MKEFRIKIELKSDLCVSDGGIYNSMLDTDICYDDYGFPYIPAKRIKGCLREAALELENWGEDAKISELFGQGGKYTNTGKLRIGNAYLESYEEYRNIVMENKNSLLFHPQNILGHFSYIRHQTSIDYDSGVAETGSLRSMRVLDKGLVFYAKAFVEDGNLYELLKNICAVMVHMGMSRTRGMGEICVTLDEQTETDDQKSREEEKNKPVALTENSNYLEYEIYLEEPVVCKSIDGAEENTQDYIEGSKILGIVSGELRKQGIRYEEFVTAGQTGENMPFICSNAYISQNGIRFYEVPGYLYEIKNESGSYINKVYETKEKKENPDEKQMNQMKHSYIRLSSDGLRKADIDIEMRYHHRRPEDKSIGRAKASADNNSDFYQISSIREGQTFKGYITGTPEQIETIYGILCNNSIQYLGMGKSSEYGKVRFTVTNTEQKNTTPETVRVKKLIAELVAPAIVYNENAMASAAPEDLVGEILAELNIADEETIKNIRKTYYLKYTRAGGYNVTWDTRKPTVSAFDKGTAVVLEFAEPLELPIAQDGQAFIGERKTQGYGEIRFIPVEETGVYQGNIIKSDPKSEVQSVTVTESDPFVKDMCDDLMRSYIKYRASEIAGKGNGVIAEKDGGQVKGLEITAEHRPVISNMTLLWKDCANMEQVQEGVKERFDKKPDKKKIKLKTAERILELVTELTENDRLTEEFMEKYHVKNYAPDKDWVQMQFLLDYLTHAKYVIRMQEMNNR